MIDIKKFSKILQNKHILAAVSGGPDSMCLLYLLNNLKKEYNLKLSACHVNYALRGADSEEDEKLVRKTCNELKIRCFVLNCGGKIKNTEKNEDNLRKIRYNFFNKIKNKIRADYIAAAHNRDDQAETILMKFIRGASLKGLSGMDYILNNNIFRPLLDFSRDEILSYLKENKIEFRIDKTNLENNYSRNKIRNKLIPLIEREYNSNFKQTMLRNSKTIKNCANFIADYADLILKNISRMDKNFIEIDYKKWLLLPETLKFETIKISAEKLAGSTQGIESAHLSEIVDMLTNKIPFGEKRILNSLSIKEKYDIIEMRIYKNKIRDY